MKISLIAAVDLMLGIGYQNQLLVSLPADLKYFKAQTWGLPVVMGRKTFESLQNKPLPGRINLVLTSQQKHASQQNVVYVQSPKQALDYAIANLYNQVMIIGGGEVYKSFLPLANQLLITQIQHQFTQVDAYFPNFKIDTTWQLVRETVCTKDEKHAFDYSFQTWQKAV